MVFFVLVTVLAGSLYVCVGLAWFGGFVIGLVLRFFGGFGVWGVVRFSGYLVFCDSVGL